MISIDNAKNSLLKAYLMKDKAKKKAYVLDALCIVCNNESDLPIKGLLEKYIFSTYFYLSIQDGNYDEKVKCIDERIRDMVNILSKLDSNYMLSIIDADNLCNTLIAMFIWMQEADVFMQLHTGKYSKQYNVYDDSYYDDYLIPIIMSVIKGKEYAKDIFRNKLSLYVKNHRGNFPHLSAEERFQKQYMFSKKIYSVNCQMKYAIAVAQAERW